MSDYATFLDRKVHAGADAGFEPAWMPDFLFGFQQALTEWALRKGRGALFADCGLGKTPMQLVWAENVVRQTNGRVLVLTPLAVSPQTIAEGEKFGIEVRRSSDGTVHAGITVTNYERLHHFDPARFTAVVCDESSILKSFDGARRNTITQFMRKVPYRLLATATPGGAGHRRREACAPAAARRDRPVHRAPQQPGRDGANAVHGRGIRSLRSRTRGPSCDRHRAQALVLPTGDPERGVC